jgi:predicted regulator of Ras-like GTPase activity (Roadblock/LC7/MglB family)
MAQMTSHFAALGKTELANLHKGTVHFPPAELESALKKGKISFSWKQVRGWIQGTDSPPGLNDDDIIEFPLNVVAPIFLASRRTVQPRRKLEVTENIPDLFSKPVAPSAFPGDAAAPGSVVEPGTASTAVGDVPPVVPTSVATPGPLTMSPPGEPAPPAVAAPPAPSIPVPKPALDFGDIFGVPDKKEWSLNDVTTKVLTLRGVSGAVITTADGLLMAGAWPGGVAAESAAGFVPQIFNRINQYSKELKLGDPGQFTLLIENVPLQIFKTGSTFFTVLGKAGEPLPKVQITALAARLSQNQKPA